ncbi:serine/threonine protein kinase [Hyalangium gracile]|uniref:serine/threonine protein kinase n=1 Tax=Hyalangium gracile TaxID=394092 RepID=UPI001CCFBFAF|nr:serine/threonine-protein kinase [Hyalangium gracile]
MSERARLVIPPGTEVRGFVIEQELGAGGFGTVFRARRGERLYALKFLRCKEAGGWARREVEILLRVPHRNVVRFEGCGFWPDDTREYLVVIMDYVEGRRLDVWAEEENPDARQVVQKVLGMVRALTEIHRVGVIHRDLKEANIIVRASDGEAVLVDFGVAGGTNTVQATRDVLPPCTLEYRSPEAWRFLRNNARQLGTRYQPGSADDLYALGVVLYWLLTGRYPCVGLTEVEQAEVTIHQVPEPPHAVNRRVPEALSAICMKLLEKHPENRHPDAGALGLALEAELARVDAAWSVPLCDAHASDNVTTVGDLARADGDDGVDHWLREARHAHERPRRGRRPAPAAPEEKPPLPPVLAVVPAPPTPAPPAGASPPGESPASELQSGPPGALELVARGPVLASERGVAHPTWSVAPRILPWAALVLGFVMVLGMAVALLPARLTPSPPASARAEEEAPAGLFVVLPEIAQGTTWKVGWKVASPWKPPEADRHYFFAAEGETVPWAPSGLREQGETSVNSPQQKQQKVPVLSSLGKVITAGVACFGVACTGPQVRPEPPAEPCPSGAIQAMAELGIDIGESNVAVFLSGPLRGYISVREGWTRARLSGRFEGLPHGTILKGRLLFGGERVYGRFTEAQEAEGSRTWPICMELLNASEERGLDLEPGSTAEVAEVFNSVVVKAVDRFQ